MEDDAEYDKALELLREVYQPHDTDAPDWICGACKETVPGTFESCWSCGAPKQGA